MSDWVDPPKKDERDIGSRSMGYKPADTDLAKKAVNDVAKAMNYRTNKKKEDKKTSWL